MTTTMAAPNKTFVPRRLLERLRGLFGHAFAATSVTEPEIPDLYPYQTRDLLLTPNETAFYQVLLAVVGRRVVISPRVRLAPRGVVSRMSWTKESMNRRATPSAMPAKLDEYSMLGVKT